jgi:hypothetical protein
MKKTRIVFWTLTVLMALPMLMASITDLIPIPEAVAGFEHYGYPTYLLPFLGIARILGLMAIFTPGFARLKEWAYAGFIFDVVLAIYSGLAVGDALVTLIPATIALLFTTGSYVFYHKLRRERAVLRRQNITQAYSAATQHAVAA